MWKQTLCCTQLYTVKLGPRAIWGICAAELLRHYCSLNTVFYRTHNSLTTPSNSLGLKHEPKESLPYGWILGINSMLFCL